MAVHRCKQGFGTMNSRIIAALLIPLILIFMGYAGYKLVLENWNEEWNPEQIYAVWIEDVEVAPKKGEGQWDSDGSAPDRVASLNWRGNTVLKTSEAPNTILAKWDRTAIQLSSLLKAKISPNELENIARIRAAKDEALTIEVQDVDVLQTEWIGGVSVACGSLRPGRNLVLVNDPACGLHAFTLRTATSDELERGRVPEGLHKVTEGVVIMAPPVRETPGAVEVQEVGKQIEKGVNFLKGIFGGEGGNE